MKVLCYSYYFSVKRKKKKIKDKITHDIYICLSNMRVSLIDVAGEHELYKEIYKKKK